MVILGLISALPIPFIMILFGYVWMKNPPEEVDGSVGYRTPMSMKNNMTFKFANKYAGGIWLRAGIPLLVSSVIVRLIFLQSASDIQNIVSEVIIICQLAGIFLSIIPTERALNKNFDKEGNPKSKH
jgi:hypothetical protein